ncbi:flagellar basal body P-ring protein FlgI [Marinicauda algicola]|uniref:Flagellar P-ring protein n=1 Tax=Marinicauda algicola TaxID=2029849 RepID=A0A4S2H3E7_9PROT|nr:flagellar basal body P-ring protein FlgI [Marinicauda algicola]TGY90023.1 flagellar basal body P-ring protein FlgI [Marinicauda algicola]
MIRTIALALLAAVLTTAAHANPRIKDIADVEGVRDNQLVGYGLVVGLDGTGDTLRNTAFTRQSLNSMLERFNVNVREADLRTGNVAAVIVTAELPPFAMQGTRIDVTVSALGDAESLQGGVLIATPLMDAQGNVYAVSQGSIAVGGFSAEGDAASITRGVPTVGRISNGALVERELGFDLAAREGVRLALRNPDFTTARRMAEAINAYLGRGAARAVNPSIVTVALPAGYERDLVGMIADIEQLRVEADMRARVVIDEATGTIVMGEDVRVSTVAIAQGNLTITVSEAPMVSQPAPFADVGETVLVPRTEINVEEEMRQMGVLEGTVSLRELVDGLNALGVSPRDMITILQTIKAAGALQAEIEVL